MLLKNLSCNNIKTVVSNFVLNVVNNSFDQVEVYMTLTFHKNI